MTVQEFLAENRGTVINYYNAEVKRYWRISLKDFMIDLMINFRKITTCEEFKKFDLIGNLEEAKSRLGLFDKMKVDVKFDRDIYRENKAPNGQWMAII